MAEWRRLCSMAKKKKTKCTLVEMRKVSEEEKARYEEIFQKERQKRERDELAGGVSENGAYVRLHDRGIG